MWKIRNMVTVIQALNFKAFVLKCAVRIWMENLSRGVCPTQNWRIYPDIILSTGISPGVNVPFLKA